MAAPARQPDKPAEANSGPPASRKLKASDLPLPSATRAAIESLAHSFKKEGAYDSIRKQVWDKFEASVRLICPCTPLLGAHRARQDYEAQVTKAIHEVAEREMERNPRQLLTLDRRKATALIDGALERSGVYQKAEEVIGKLIDNGAIEARIREIRRADIGDDAAEAERVRGSKTDEQYAADTQARKAERERLRQELRQKEAAIEEEKRRIAKEERRREERERQQAEIKREAERDERRKLREKEKEEREKRRDKEREDRHKERERRDRKRERERDKGRERERDREGHREDERERGLERGQAYDSGRDSRLKDPKATSEELKERLTKEENERLEQEALADLLRESSKAARAQPQLEVDADLAPPPRRTGASSTMAPMSKISDSRKLVDARDSKKAADSGPQDAGRGSRSASWARDKDRRRLGDHSWVRDSGDSRHRDRRSRSPRRDRSRSRGGDRRVRSRSRLRRSRSRSRRSDDFYDGSRSRGKRERSRRSRSHRRDRSRSQLRSNRRHRSRDRDGADSHQRSDRRRRSRSRSRRDRSWSRDSRRAVADHYNPRESSRLSSRRRSRDRVRGRERDRDRDTDRRRARRSHSRSRPGTSAARPASVAKEELEEWKLEEVKKREKEAKAYLAAQKDAREKGLPVPGVDDRPSGKTDLEAAQHSAMRESLTPMSPKAATNDAGVGLATAAAT